MRFNAKRQMCDGRRIQGGLRKIFPGVILAAVARPSLFSDVAPWFEEFMGEICNHNTRQAYRFALERFLDWCIERDVDPASLVAHEVSSYLLTYPGSGSTRRQHLAAIRKMYEWLEHRGLASASPAAGVRLPANAMIARKSAPTAQQARTLLDCIDIERPVGLRDRALIGLLIFSLVKISTALNLRLGDYQIKDNQAFLRVSEHGRFKLIPVHHQLRVYIDEYLVVLGDRAQDEYLFPSSDRSRRGDQLLDLAMTGKGALKMLKRRIKQAKLPDSFDSQSFRLVGIREYLRGGGDLQTVARIAGYGSVSSLVAQLGVEQVLGNEEIDRIVI